MSDIDFDVVVIGGGPGGVETAAESGSRGLRTAIVSAMPAGGRATYGSLLPSKAWLHASGSAAGEAGSPRGGDRPLHAAGSAAGGLSNLHSLRERIRQLQTERTAQLEHRLDEVGVERIRGDAKLLNRSTVIVSADGETRTLSGRNIVIASGSEPRFFANVRPDGDRIIAPRHTQLLQEVPASIVMVGGGVTGVEYASAFRKMGSDVHLITDIERLLPRTDPELAERLQGHLERLGVTFTFDTAIERVESDGTTVRTVAAGGAVFESEYGFIATGRRPDTALLAGADEQPQLDAGGWIATGESGRTSLPGVYAVGDVAGPPLTANHAHLLARRIVASIEGNTPGSTPAIIEAVYTEPQLAHVGPVSELASASGEKVRLIVRELSETLIGRIHGDTGGVVKLWVDADTGAIRGAGAFGAHVVELLAPVQLAMEHSIPYARLRETPFAHPATAEVLTL